MDIILVYPLYATAFSAYSNRNLLDLGYEIVYNEWKEILNETAYKLNQDFTINILTLTIS